MPRLGRLRLFAVLGLLGLAFAWDSPAWGHRLTHEARKSAHSLKGELEAQPSFKSGPGQPESSVFRSCGGEKVFDLLKSVNAHPRDDKHPAMLLDLAGLAETHGCVDLAIKVYTLAATLHPHSPYGRHAVLKRLTLEFYLELGSADPFSAFRSYLAKLSQSAFQFAAEDLQEPLSAGWRAVEQAIRNQVVCSYQTLEKALDLWELQPPGLRPPEGALILGRLLRDYGLLEEAGALLSQAHDQGTGPVRPQALLELLQLAWDAGGPPAFLQTLGQQSQDFQELALALKTWPLQLGTPGSARPDPHDDLLGDLKEVLVNQTFSLLADTPVGTDIHVWQILLSQQLPDPLRDFLAQSAAKALCREKVFTEAEKLYQKMLSRTADRDSSLFLWDRLGLVHLRTHQVETAQDIFQRLEKEPGSLWPLVARTRQLDLELSRVLAKPAS